MSDRNTNARIQSRDIDGSIIWQSDDDTRNENEVAALCERAWSCTLHRFTTLCPIDWYAVRGDSLVGVVELKTRAVSSMRYDTVFLAVRKWLALQYAAASFGVPAIFAARFSDGLRYISVAHVDATRTRIAGARDDVEPVIDVPVAAMRAVNESEDFS